MLVYFHIDELARDAVVASALKKELKRIGDRLVYGNRTTTHLILRYFNVFDVIILPSLAHYIDAFPDSKHLPNNIVILQTEAIGQATGVLRRLNGKYFGDDSNQCEPWHKAVSLFLLWGYSHLNSFRQYYPFYFQKCKVVGHPRLSKSCNRPKKKVLVPTREPTEKLVIGFVSRFNLLNPFDNRTPFESVCNGMKFGKPIFPLFENSNDKDVEDLFYTEVIDFRVMIQVMKSLDSNRYKLDVRSHPRENRQGWERLAKKLGINIKVSPWDEPFGHWLQKVDLIIMPPSTSLYDIFFHGKIPIVISHVVASRENHILTESDDNNQILEAVCRPKSVDEILSIIESGKVTFNDEIVCQKLLEQVAADIADMSIINIINALVDLGMPTKERRAKIRQYFLYGVYEVFSLSCAYLKWFRNRVWRRDIEQGSSFHLIISRIRWINRLTTSK